MCKIGMTLKLTHVTSAHQENVFGDHVKKDAEGPHSEAYITLNNPLLTIFYWTGQLKFAPDCRDISSQGTKIAFEQLRED